MTEAQKENLKKLLQADYDHPCLVCGHDHDAHFDAAERDEDHRKLLTAIEAIIDN